ncbi:ACP S-malonyltransferase [Streptomyces sp. NPDC048297]|uniref:ACP S-malonyltransferase n=1 Tax=Streptomyces sp. NPDC048297 TaxID=3365531 RepID=UPI00371AF174
MCATTVHLFPGQGDFSVRAFTVGLAQDTHLRRAAQDVFAEIDEATETRGLPALGPRLLGDAPPSGLELARLGDGAQQIALYGASVSVHRTLAARYGEPAALLGVSFGEIAALTAAEAWSVGTGALVAHDLTRVLGDCPGGLTLLTCDEATAAELIAQSATASVVIACVNDDQETVVCGPLTELTAVETGAQRLGLAAHRLKLPFGSHHPAFDAQAARFADFVRSHTWQRPRHPVFSAVAGRSYAPGEDLAARLGDCLDHPARLPGLLHLMDKTGYTVFREAGPGSALARSVRRVLPTDRTSVTAPLARTTAP